MNSQKPSLEDYFPAIPKASTSAIVLTVQGHGHVPSFKNNKSIFRNKKTGQPFIATNPKKKKWMENVIRDLESQFAGLFPIGENEMVGEWRNRLLTASFLPLNDSLGWMIPGQQNVKFVERGEEGAIILIEKL